ncbi:MAG TPA: bifunctional DNA-formamidopyrimidine glycosylase/DNA-(apurinic or apyrimidinic site) lyase [Thermoanaerobaculia bacterium]|nr:bifunctional DNA-formamidopyrimidine glycosylase/DNA-(apurinic or apyrimidinic site) lyase [Thermoanaerobaculia bacterium]
MPELPEVEVLRRSLEPHLLGATVERVEVRSPALREPLDGEGLVRDVEGRRVAALRRRAKYLLVDLAAPTAGAGPESTAEPTTLVLHLGMSGRITVAPPGEPVGTDPHEHLVFHLASGPTLRFRDPRRFGRAFSLPTAAVEADRRFARLGIEPLGPQLSGDLLRRAARGRRGPVKPFLMDASVVVGVGNIYASEALWEAGIHPTRSVARIAPARWERLAEAVRRVLTRAIAEGGTTLNDFADGEGRSGYFQVSLAVYDREGEPCRRCATPIRRRVQAGRSTFYCPGCQT